MSHPHIGFVMEQTLGHITHDMNLQTALASQDSITFERFPVVFQSDDLYERIPIVKNNWTLKASLRTRDWLKTSMHAQPFDALFFHTQVTTLFSIGLMHRHPSIISMDATPKNIDTLGAAYHHTPSRIRWLEAWKDTLNNQAYRAANHIITWCHWAKNSLIQDYGVDGDKITVIPPGVNLDKWNLLRNPKDDSSLRILFVGGDFQRKGGETLLNAFAKLPDNCTLDIVTKDPMDTSNSTRIQVHNGIKANSTEILSLFEKADIFVFPTNGDCLPIAVMEAMAASLPVIATNVGAISEEVVDGKTGFLIPPVDEEVLVDRILYFLRNRSAMMEMGINGRRRAEELFDSQKNYQKLIECLLNIS